MPTGSKLKPYQTKGTKAPWYRGWDLTEDQRDRFRRTSIASQAAKALALNGGCEQPKHPIPTSPFQAELLMPLMPSNGFRTLSLFSGGGGLDIGFDRAGYEHVASYEIMPNAAEVLRCAKPEWTVFGGAEGDVCHVDWLTYRDTIDVLHGGPPCQPFSHAGYRSGANDLRDMFPQFVRAVKGVRPRAFIAENVSGLATKKFQTYLEQTIFQPLGKQYRIVNFTLDASAFGVPQRRRRIFFVGFREKECFSRFAPPPPTHTIINEKQTQLPLAAMILGEDQANCPRTLGARAALGLLDIGYDGVAPTIRSGLTGPRHTTSVVNSVSAMKEWDALHIWPNGVAENRQKASEFIAPNGHFRLSIPDCMLLQGFPSDWPFHSPVYKALGLIGNSVAPPMGYHVARAVALALGAD